MFVGGVSEGVFFGLGVEPVADPPDGHDPLAQCSKLLPQPGHMGVHGAVETLEVAAPDPLDEELEPPMLPLKPDPPDVLEDMAPKSALEPLLEDELLPPV